MNNTKILLYKIVFQ